MMSELEAKLDALTEIGWFEGVPEAKAEEMRREYAEIYGQEPSAAYQALADYTFDTEMIYDTGAGSGESYHDVVAEAAAESRGLFSPESIEDGMDDGGFWVRFTLGGRAFELKNLGHSDYVDPRMFELIDGALESVGCAERAYVIQIDQAVGIAFRTPEVMAGAVRAGVFQADDIEQFMGRSLEDLP